MTEPTLTESHSHLENGSVYSQPSPSTYHSYNPSELMRDEKVPAFHEGPKPLFRHALKRDIRASLLALLRSASTPMTPSRHTPCDCNCSESVRYAGIVLLLSF